MTEDRRPEGAPWRNFYGRRRGKKLRPSQEGYLEDGLAEVRMPQVGWQENPDRTKVELGAVFPGRSEVWLEIGFGAGEHLVALAEANPTVGIIGAEPYINGVAALMGKVRAAGTGNIAIHPGDARDLFDVIPHASLARVYLLYPDPWPKKRHHRRRFVTPEHLDPLAEVMAPAAELRIATDIGDYVRQSLEELLRHPAFEWLGESAADWREPWDGWTRTRYEAKAIREGRTPHYLRFRRR